MLFQTRDLIGKNVSTSGPYFDCSGLIVDLFSAHYFASKISIF